MLQYLASFLTSVAVSALLTWLVRDLASRFGLAKPPDSSRHIHSTAIPRLGGLAVFVAFVSLFLVYLFATTDHRWGAAPRENDVAHIVLIGALFFVVGLVDDLITIKPWVKLLVEVAGAVALYMSGIHPGFSTAHAGSHWAGAISLGLTVFWVVLICNAINLIDGLDGLAAGAALFSMVTIFTLAVGSRPGVATATTILAGSLFGFLIFNFNPASIFLGDSGSLFVGFVLSAFVLAESQRQVSTMDSILVPVVSFALPLTDVCLSLLRRLLSGHSIFGADREHIHHKLLELGLTQRQVVWILYGISALCAVLSLFLLSPSILALIPVAAIMLMLVFFGLRKLKYPEFGEFQRIGQRLKVQKKVLARNIALRKAAAGLETARDAADIAAMLEDCLADDFDGFEIILDEKFVPEGFLENPEPCRSVKLQWRASRERLILTLELSNSRGRPIGRFSIYQSAGRLLLIDTELLKGAFRHSLERALQNTMARSVLRELPVAGILESPETAVPAGHFENEV
ncbi:MAG TPA: MraY family glycosyltransferase [Candidatus Angelobacter sp.]|nr:MraY family glycosyltransferase [Candidatus Angelobacter sp.]